MTKKGFTLVEMLVVVLIIAVVFAMYSASYEGTRRTRRVERARASFVEFANAARLFNEMFSTTRLVGKFGDTMGVSTTGVDSKCPGCVDPCSLFQQCVLEENRPNMHAYALNPVEWGLDADGQCHCTANLQYNGGFEFILCNPYFDDESQPDGCDSDTFAIMNIPAAASFGKYQNKHVWITRGYEIQDDFGINNNG